MRLQQSLSLGCSLASLLSLPACLEPAASDYPTYSHRIKAADAAVPAPDDRLTIRLTGADGFGDEPLKPTTGYLDGEPAQYWNLGEASPVPQTAWVFRKLDTKGDPVDFGHPALVDNIPGDEGYSPLCKIQIVFVTTRYADMQITSFAALEDAIELGLAQDPVDTDQIVQWPIAREGAQLELPDGSEVNPTRVYYRGHQVNAFMLEQTLPALTEVMATFRGVTPGDAYGLRRENEAAVMGDSYIFSQAPGTPGYTGMWTPTTIMVDAAYESGGARSTDALFTTNDDGEQSASDTVIAIEPGQTVHFWPLIPAN